MQHMTTAEAIVASLIAHKLDTLYALPGVQNDHLFDALFKAHESMRVVHTRHEQGAAYMALGAALATGRPQACAVVPGPGLLNASAALLTAYSMNAQVLALVGQIPDFDIGRKLGHLHEINDQAGIIARLVDHSALIPSAEDAPRMVAEAFHAMASGRPGPAALECGINVWGKPGEAAPFAPLPVVQPAIDEDALREAARKLGAAKRPMIVVGGGAQGSSPEVTTLADILQAPVLCGFRRGQGVLDSRNPLAVTLPLGRELWGEADVVLAVGTRLFFQHKMWGVDDDLSIVAVNADPQEPFKHRKPAVALIGDAAPILRRLIAALETTNAKRPSRSAEMKKRHAKWDKKLAKLDRQKAIVEAIRDELPEDGIFVDEVTQVGFAARLMMPVYKPRTFLSPGYQDNLGWGYATALGAQDARRDVPVLSINGDGGFMYTANELATAVRHRIPLTAIVFADGSFGNVRRIQEEDYGNRLIASDLANPDFVKFADSFGVAAERVRTPESLRKALRRAFKRGEPTLIEMPVGPMPSPWEFVLMGKVRG
jgi:acetolactate synthase-1/2/3 large subunit